MEAVPKAKEIERLLAEGDWIRGLAAGLLGDPQRAEDLAQETYLAALRRPMQGGGSLRPWLATVARNAARMLHRSEGARRSRETDVARDRRGAVQRSPEEWLSQMETQEMVSRLVRELPPELSEVLMLHYFEGMGLNAIAQQLGVPAGTVRWRKMRALECLKERLDKTHGGDRQAWLSALAPLAVPRWRDGAQVAVGGAAASGLLAPWIAMTLTWKLVSLTLLVALLAIPFVNGADPEAQAPAAGLHADENIAAVLEPAAEKVELEGQTLESGTQDATQRQAVVPTHVPEAIQPITRVRLRVVNDNGDPISGATVDPSPSLELQRSHLDLVSMGSLEAALFATQMRRVTGKDGVASWESDLLREDGVVDFLVKGPRHGTGELTAALEVGADADLGDVVLSRAGGVQGRVADQQGRGLKGKRVALHPVQRDALGQEIIEETTLLGSLEWPGTRTERGGEYTMQGVAPGEYRTWAQDHAEGPFFQSEPFVVVEGQLTRMADIRTAGQPKPHVPASLTVLGSDGKALATAHVRLEGEYVSSSGVVGEDGTWGTSKNLKRFEGGRLLVSDRSFRHHPVEIDPLPEDMGAQVIRMQSAPHVVRTLHVTDANGGSIESVLVGVTVEQGGDSLGSMETRPGRSQVSLPDASLGPISITVQASGFLIEAFEVPDADDLPEPWLIKLAQAPGIRGLVMAGDKPLKGAKLKLVRQVKAGHVNHKGNAITRASDATGDKAQSASDGTFELAHPHDGAFVLVASARGFAEAVVELPDYQANRGAQDVVFEMKATGVIEGTVYDHLGQPVPRAYLVLNHPFHKLHRRRAGRDGSFRIRRVPGGEWVMRAVEEFDSSMFGQTMPVEDAWSFPTNCTVVAGETVSFDLHLPDPADSVVAGVWMGSEGWNARLSTLNGGLFGGDPFENRWSEERELEPDAEFEFPVQSGRDYHLRLSTPGMVGLVTRTIQGTELPARLQPPAEFVTFRAVPQTPALPGAPPANLIVEWSQDPWAFRSYLTAKDDGSFGPTLVPTGSLNLTQQIPGTERAESHTVEIPAGQDALVEL